MVRDTVSVEYLGMDVGVMAYTEGQPSAFEYSKSFLDSGIELSPLYMPLGEGVYTFPTLNPETFKGLAGLFADSLPDDFGNRILNAWTARNGRSPDSITPLERLKYTGKRGMGALEYHPMKSMNGFNASQQVEILELIKIAQDVLDTRSSLEVDLNNNGAEDKDAMLALLSVGTSAGGARPKAVLAFNEDYSQVRSGQTDVPDGFTHYLMKFDGVSEHNVNKETFGDPMGYGAMEYVYHQMALKCGIEMMPCKLLQEGDRQHFITQRFDRVGNEKIHIQSLNGLAHVDYKKPGSFSYEEIFNVNRHLRLTAAEAEQLFRRMVFNVVSRNHDDHSKNFGYMLVDNQWKLAPAYDLAYSYKPNSFWVDQHWMTLNGKRDNFEMADFLSFEKLSPIFNEQRIRQILEEVIEAVSSWTSLAVQSNVPKVLIERVEQNLRLKF